MTPKERLTLLMEMLQAIEPEALITRDLEELEKATDVPVGIRVYCIMSSGFPAFGGLPRFAEDEQHEIIIFGQHKSYEETPGDVIEDIELDMLESIRTLVQTDYASPEPLCLKLKSARGSMQEDRPYSKMAFWLVFDDL